LTDSQLRQVFEKLGGVVVDEMGACTLKFFLGVTPA
jgi:hypothetical protein